MENQTVKIFPNSESISNELAELIQSKVSNLKYDEYFTLAVSGGETPKQIFEYLSQNHSYTIDWEKVKIFWTDERCVPPGDKDSNYKMAYESFISKISIQNKNIFRIYGENDPSKEAIRYSETIKDNVQLINGLPVFDLMLLGVGEDGHTASIFPNQIHLFYSNEYCVVAKHPQTFQSRITLSGKVINNSKQIAFIVTGFKKAPIIARVINNTNTQTLPAQLVLPSNGKLFWLIDSKAAQLL